MRKNANMLKNVLSLNEFGVSEQLLNSTSARDYRLFSTIKSWLIVAIKQTITNK